MGHIELAKERVPAMHGEIGDPTTAARQHIPFTSQRISRINHHNKSQIMNHSKAMSDLTSIIN